MDLIIVRGLPGAGKSEFSKKLMKGYNEDVLWYEADHYFMKDGVYNFDPSKLAEAHRVCRENTRYALSKGYNVIVSNTFSTKWEMQPYLDMAEEYGATVFITECRGKFKNIHGCPQDVIDRMEKRWETI